MLLTGISELVSSDPDLGVLADAAIAIDGERITWVGAAADAPTDPEVVDLGRRAVLPGFVDAHTHVVFASDRADEFGLRLGGASYEELLAKGWGIHSTVRATRGATAGELFDQAAGRLRRMLAGGTTTVEVKSGYGLSARDELRMLRIARRLGDELPLDVVTTFLGAHVVPTGRRRDEYVAEIVDEMLPPASELAEYCDVFCDEGAFTVDEARTILSAASEHGMGLRIHAEQLAASGGAALAAELRAASADHLDHITAGDTIRLADAGTVAVLLPVASWMVGGRMPPARRLWDAGVQVALATDCNPGTAYVESMAFVVALAVLEMGLSPLEAVWAATRGGALSLQRDDIGWIRPGALADLVVLDAPSHLHIPYRPATNLVWRVYKRGAAVVG